ncbi:hypothetical protein BASA81_003051 [Batrachochytrium salamandrivorans]|nr:hypothetical protein BASA81_003051 [Batrachochytrium salamandrivorans]
MHVQWWTRVALGLVLLYVLVMFGMGQGNGGYASQTIIQLPPPPPPIEFHPDMLDQVHCIPQICKSPESFAHSLNFTLLASYPGSGNTWTRTIVEAGTKVWTGSVYKDQSLMSSGFKGEALEPFVLNVSRTSAIKTHYPYYLQGGLTGKTSGVVLVMRSPFDAILAEFTRRFGKVNRENGITSYEFIQQIGKHQVPVLVLFYEDFVRNIVVTSERLFRFLKQQLGKEMPTSAIEAMLCTVTHGQEKQTKEKRQHRKNEYNIYFDKVHPIGKQGLVKQACEKWAPYWFEDVWGKCEDPTPQVTRFTPSTVELDKIANITGYCGEEERGGVEVDTIWDEYEET